MFRALAIGFCLAVPAAAQTSPEPVDMALVIAVDVSRSMSSEELDIQRRGYAEALSSPEVLAAIRSGPYGRIAISYVEWAGMGAQRVVVDWVVIAAAEDALTLAAVIELRRAATMRRTSLSGAIDFGRERLAALPYPTWRRVIDISGDGPNNQGRVVTEARDAAVAAGITINGLPLMTRGGGGGFDLEALDEYYRACVIGGAGAFVLPVHAWGGFAEAVQRKLVLEISGLAALGLMPAQMQPAAEVDCLIGEKFWEQRNTDPDFR